MARTKTIAVLCAGAVLLAGCQSAPAPALETGDVPDSFVRNRAAETPPWPDRSWWRGFASDELSGLLYEAEAQSFDTRTAALRVIQAEQAARTAGAPLWPQLSLSAGGSRRGSFEEASAESASLSTSLGLSYEVDLWGRLRADRAAGLAALAGSRYDQATVGITVASGVAGGYLQVLSLRDQIAVAKRNLDIAEQVLALVEARVREGASPPLDLASQQAAAARQRASIPALEQQEREALAALALLVGRPAQGFAVSGRSLEAVLVPPVAPGLPSELLMRRPDIARAEANLAGANANVAAARAALLPTVSLSGSTGLSSAALRTLVDPASTAWNLGASLSTAIFDAGRRGAQVTSTRAGRDALIIAYRETVLTAFSEVDLALTAIEALAVQRADREIETEAAREAFRIAQVRYRAGSDDIQPTLQAQAALFSAENQLTQLKLAEAQAAITLFRALGGGWSRGGAA